MNVARRKPSSGSRLYETGTRSECGRHAAERSRSSSTAGRPTRSDRRVRRRCSSVTLARRRRRAPATSTGSTATRYRPDPVSRLQPEGVHGPSVVVDPHALRRGPIRRFRGHALADLVFYELHVGHLHAGRAPSRRSFPHLPRLVELGVTAIELMPIAEFPGSRNWGYDGVHLYAPQSTYGGPRGLRRLVDACHARGLSRRARRRLQPPRPRGQLPGRVRPVLHRPLQDAVGHRDQLRRPRQRGRAPSLRRERALLGPRVPHRRPPARRHPLDLRREPGPHPHRARRGGRARRRARSGRPRPRHRRVARQRSAHRAAARRRAGSAWTRSGRTTSTTRCTAGSPASAAATTSTSRDGTDLARAIAEGFAYQGEPSEYFGRPRGTPSADLGRRATSSSASRTTTRSATARRATGSSTSCPSAAVKLAAALLFAAPASRCCSWARSTARPRRFSSSPRSSTRTLVEAVRRGRTEEFSRFGWRGHVPDPGEPATFLQLAPESLAGRRAAPPRAARVLPALAHAASHAPRARRPRQGARAVPRSTPSGSVLTLTREAPGRRCASALVANLTGDSVGPRAALRRAGGSCSTATIRALRR